MVRSANHALARIKDPEIPGQLVSDEQLSRLASLSHRDTGFNQAS